MGLPSNYLWVLSWNICWMKWSWPDLRRCLDTCLEVVRQNMQIQSSLFTGWNLNPVPSSG
jgi:hypothetical protein